MRFFDPTRLARTIIVMEGWRAALLAFLAGTASALALAPFHLLPVVFITIPIFVWLLDGAVAPAGAGRWRRYWPAFRTGWLFGFGYFLGGLWWLGQAFLVDADEFAILLPLAVIGLPALLALFWGWAAVIARMVWSSDWRRLIAFALALTLAEMLRGHIWTGFPWNLFGTTIMPTPVMMQSAGLIGAYGVTLLAFFVTAAPALFAPGDGVRPRRLRGGLIIAAALVLGHIGYGAFLLAGASDETVPGVRLRLVQPAIDQQEKWKAENAAPIFRSYLDLSRSNTGPQTASAAAFTHIIWPESAFPFILAEQRAALSAIDDLLGEDSVLITGAMRREPPVEGAPEPDVFNSLLVLNGAGEIIAARDKTQLVPFGEFLPFQSMLEGAGFQQLTQLRGGFAAGQRRALVDAPDAPPFLSLICYEIIYPGGFDAAENRPGWIVNLTNDAWFGATPGPYQHAHQAQIRAAETGIPLVRVANSGITFIADGYGRVEERLPLGFKGVLDGDLPPVREATLFAQSGNVPMLVFLLLAFVALIGLRLADTKRLH